MKFLDSHDKFSHTLFSRCFKVQLTHVGDTFDEYRTWELYDIYKHIQLWLL